MYLFFLPFSFSLFSLCTAFSLFLSLIHQYISICKSTHPYLLSTT
jgi:hypothetical protein